MTADTSAPAVTPAGNGRLGAAVHALAVEIVSGDDPAHGSRFQHVRDALEAAVTDLDARWPPGKMNAAVAAVLRGDGHEPMTAAEDAYVSEAAVELPHTVSAAGLARMTVETRKALARLAGDGQDHD